MMCPPFPALSSGTVGGGGVTKNNVYLCDVYLIKFGLTTRSADLPMMNMHGLWHKVSVSNPFEAVPNGCGVKLLLINLDYETPADYSF